MLRGYGGKGALYTAGGNVNGCSHCGKQQGGLQKTENRVTI